MPEQQPIQKTKPFRIYMSHSIRGKNGVNATQEEIDKNIEHAIEVGTQIQAYAIDWEKMEGFPPINIYVPANHDEFVQIAYHEGYLNETQILDTDCIIINRCDLVIVYGEPYSRGMQIELSYATRMEIPVFKMPVLNEMTIDALRYVIYLLLKSKE